jgi:hypothetical protein
MLCSSLAKFAYHTWHLSMFFNVKHHVITLGGFRMAPLIDIVKFMNTCTANCLALATAAEIKSSRTRFAALHAQLMSFFT